MKKTNIEMDRFYVLTWIISKEMEVQLNEFKQVLSLYRNIPPCRPECAVFIPTLSKHFFTSFLFNPNSQLEFFFFYIIIKTSTYISSTNFNITSSIY